MRELSFGKRAALFLSGAQPRRLPYRHGLSISGRCISSTPAAAAFRRGTGNLYGQLLVATARSSRSPRLVL